MATLLLADDSMTTQKVVSLTFADEGVEVLTAADGDTAVRLYRERRPDIVLADVNIPGLSGYEICEEIRKTSDLATTPVVLLVGSFEPFDANEAHRVGANDYLTKPFSSIRRLVATVLAFLDDQPTTEAPHATVDEPVQEISVEPPQEETIEAQPDESTAPTAEYDSSEIADADEHAAGQPASERSESLAESAVGLVAESAGPPVADEPDFKATNDIEELYSQSFAETVEMPHTLAERAQFSDVSSDDGLIEAQFTAPAVEETDETVYGAAEAPIDEQTVPADSHASVEAATDSDSSQAMPETAGSERLPIESPVPEHAPEPTNGYSTWSEPSAADDRPPVTFEEHPHDAPTERLTPQNAPTDEYNFEFRGEEAFFEPAIGDTPEPTPAEDLSTDQNYVPSGTEGVETPAENFAGTTTASTPWETVASPIDGEMKFDDRNLLEIPGPSAPADLQGEPGLSLETVEHIARIVASQMSEQIIREIAERVVPMVVQQTLANKRDDSSN